MRGSSLSDNAIVELLRPFIITSWHASEGAAMPAEIKELFAQANLPQQLNVFAFALDSRGRLVHGFVGLPGRGSDRADYSVEINKALAKLNLAATPGKSAARQPALPDFPAASGARAGVRIFIRLDDPADTIRNKIPVIELVPMKAEEWSAFAFPATGAKEIPAEKLRSWLVQLYPAGIRTADQKIPFREIRGALKLEPAGADAQSHTALLSGKLQIAKESGANGGEGSAFDGTLQAVLTYSPLAPNVRSLRGVIEGNYLYRVRGAQPMPLRAAIESRPE